MADVHVTMGYVGTRIQTGDTVKIFQANGLQSEVVTSGVASAATTITAGKRQIAKIHCATAVYATGGSDPTATAANGTYVAPNVAEYISLKEGDKIAVIDV